MVSDSKRLKPWQIAAQREWLRAAHEKFESVKQVGEQVGISLAQSQRRYKRAKEAGSILGQKMLIDPQHMGYMGHAFLDILLLQPAKESRILQYPEIQQLFKIGDMHYLAQVYYEFPEDLDKLLKRMETDLSTKYIQYAQVRDAWL